MKKKVGKGELRGASARKSPTLKQRNVPATELIGKRTIDAIWNFAKENGLSLEQVLLNQRDFLIEDTSQPGKLILSMEKVSGNKKDCPK